MVISDRWVQETSEVMVLNTTMVSEKNNLKYKIVLVYNCKYHYILEDE